MGLVSTNLKENYQVGRTADLLANPPGGFRQAEPLIRMVGDQPKRFADFRDEAIETPECGSIGDSSLETRD